MIITGEQPESYVYLLGILHQESVFSCAPFSLFSAEHVYVSLFLCSCSRALKLKGPSSTAFTTHELLTVIYQALLVFFAYRWKHFTPRIMYS